MAKAAHITSETRVCRGMRARATKRQNDTTLLERLKKKKCHETSLNDITKKQYVFEEFVRLGFRKPTPPCLGLENGQQVVGLCFLRAPLVCALIVQWFVSRMDHDSSAHRAQS